MRWVNKQFEEVPEALQRGFEAVKERLLEQKSAHQFDGRIYNTAIKNNLEALYHKKCAYCEQYMSDKDFTVEHYRPKKGSFSYYWLGYEWTNLLPVCIDCNNPKGDKFPVAVPERVLPNSDKISRRKEPLLLDNGDLDLTAMKANHAYLLDENPLLLHPEVDDPSTYLYVDRTGRIMEIYKKTEDKEKFDRAKNTIELTGLNRDPLVKRRRQLIEQFEDSLRLQAVRFLKTNIPTDFYEKAVALAFFSIFEKLETAIQEKEEFTLTAWSTRHKIEEILFNPVSKENEDLAQLLSYSLDVFLQSKTA